MTDYLIVALDDGRFALVSVVAVFTPEQLRQLSKSGQELTEPKEKEGAK